MKKFILPISILVFFFPVIFGQVYAQEKQPSNKITCDEVWEIVGTDDCERWVVSNSEGGVWCNLPGTRESLQPWIYGPAPKYTFTPGTCKVESEDQVQEEQETGKSKPSQPHQTQSKQAGQNANQTKPNKDGNPLSIFGFNPLETWRNIQGLLDIPEGLSSLVQTAEILSGPAEVKINIPNPSISTDSEGNLWNFLPGYVPPEGGKVSITSGQGQMKPSGFDQFIPVINSGTSEMVTYTFFGSTFKNSGKDVSQFSYIWNTNSGAVINVFPQAEVQFVKPVLGEDVKETKRIIKLNKGNIEVKVKNTNAENKFGAQTDFLDLLVIGTHFWMSHDPNSKKTVVGVYEGKVEVKTKDGQITTVSPSGDKPGVVIVAQKLSVVKLAITGLVLAVVFGGAIFILRKRGSSKSFKKRK